MEWESFVDEGVVEPDDSAKTRSMPRLNEAWDGVIRARQLCLDHAYGYSDAEVRQAMAAAGDSLCLYYGYRLADPATFETSRRICSAFFKPGIADAVFERACILGEMLPLPSEELDPDVSKRVRHSIGASAELCAMVEAFVYFQ